MSDFGKINWLDALKGFVVAVLTSVTAALYSVLKAATDANTMPDLGGWQSWLVAGLVAGIGYLVKNVFTNSDNQLLKPEQK